MDDCIVIRADNAGKSDFTSNSISIYFNFIFYVYTAHRTEEHHLYNTYPCICRVA